jgi:hypothetical protein
MKVSVVRRCLGEVLYLRLTQTFVGAPPQGAPPSLTMKLFCPDVYWVSDPPTQDSKRPTKLYFGANGYIRKVRWSRWRNDGSSARGEGEYLVNYCVPNCAQGKSRFFKVAITLSKPVFCDRVSEFIWWRLRWRYSAGRPKGAPRSYALSYRKPFCQAQ